jgi:lipopolysaccharide biosynthesis protein
MQPNRVAFFAHYDAGDRVRPYVTEHLARLRPMAERIVFVSTSRLPESEVQKLRPYAETILLKDNAGFDFGMWQHALERTDLGHCDELILTNSSVFGPIHPLGPIFGRMNDSTCDFWGMTDNFEYRWHLQSYFLVFRQRALQSDAFRAFFRSVLPYRDKGPVVLGYEVGLTSFLVENGLRPGAVAPVESWASWASRRRMDLERSWNPTLFHPEKLLSLGMPYVKVMLLRDNVGRVPLAPVYRAMATSGYDLRLIDLDRTPRSETFRERARRVWNRVAPPSDGYALSSIEKDPAPPMRVST